MPEKIEGVKYIIPFISRVLKNVSGFFTNPLDPFIHAKRGPLRLAMLYCSRRPLSGGAPASAWAFFTSNVRTG
jgi:hypothetical protein